MVGIANPKRIVHPTAPFYVRIEKKSKDPGGAIATERLEGFLQHRVHLIGSDCFA